MNEILLGLLERVDPWSAEALNPHVICHSLDAGFDAPAFSLTSLVQAL